MCKHYLARIGFDRSVAVEDRRRLQVRVRMMFEGQRGRAIEAHKYRPSRPLRSVVKEQSVECVGLAQGT